MGKKKHVSIVNNSVQVGEFFEYIDDENVRICIKQNGNIVGTRNYIIKEKYENEKRQLEEQIHILKLQINENVKLREELERKLQNLINDKNVLEQKIKHLEDENIELKQENIILKQENVELRQEVKELKQENVALRQEVKELKQENIVLKQENVALRQEVKELKQENVALRQEVKELKQEISDMRKREIVKTLLIILQDINKHWSIENNSNKKYAECLKKIRIERNGISHYIDEINDSENLRDYKCFKILDSKIKNILIQCEDYINKKVKCKNYLSDFLNWLEEEKKTHKNNIEVSKEDDEDVEMWMEDNYIL
jgi:chromosome segregation ATPase